MSRIRDPRCWAPALVCIACLVGMGIAHVDPVRRKEPPPVHTAEISAEGRALLGDLAIGERLMGWTVRELDGPRDGLLRVELARDDVRFSLAVAAKGTRVQAGPVETERYVIFYGYVYPADTVLPETTIRATTHALARRIRAREATVTVPGL